MEPNLTEGIIGEAYEQADAAVGKLLAAMGPDAERANIVVVSLGPRVRLRPARRL